MGGMGEIQKNQRFPTIARLEYRASRLPAGVARKIPAKFCEIGRSNISVQFSADNAQNTVRELWENAIVGLTPN
jgi:hypothetical protein